MVSVLQGSERPCWGDTEDPMKEAGPPSLGAWGPATKQGWGSVWVEGGGAMRKLNQKKLLKNGTRKFSITN